MRPLRTTAWFLMTFLAIGVAGYAVIFLLMPSLNSQVGPDRMARMPLALIAHVAGGLVAMVIGPFQLHRGLRSRALGLHRALGRVYVLAVMAGGLGGLWLAFFSQLGMVTHVGFGLLALAWLISTAMAWRRIVAGDRIAHREWMIRSFALTLAAVTLRIYLPLSLVAGVPFEAGYKVIAWACWVPNLLIAEAVIRVGRLNSKSLVAV